MGGYYSRPNKDEAIIEWLTPTDIHKIHSFMGMVNYHRFINEGFSKIANPIIKLQRKNKKIV